MGTDADDPFTQAAPVAADPFTGADSPAPDPAIPTVDREGQEVPAQDFGGEPPAATVTPEPEPTAEDAAAAKAAAEEAENEAAKAAEAAAAEQAPEPVPAEEAPAAPQEPQEAPQAPEEEPTPDPEPVPEPTPAADPPAPAAASGPGPRGGKGEMRYYQIAVQTGPTTWEITSLDKVPEGVEVEVKDGQKWVKARNNEHALRLGFVILGSPAEGATIWPVPSGSFKAKRVKPAAPKPERTRLEIG